MSRVCHRFGQKCIPDVPREFEWVLKDFFLRAVTAYLRSTRRISVRDIAIFDELLDDGRVVARHQEQMRVYR